MGRLLIVSNRLPISIRKRVSEVHFLPSVGGLATGLSSFYRSYRIFLSQREVENYYYGFCNKTIWPLFHYFTQYAIYSKSLWKAYKGVNAAFCDTIIKVAKPDDIIFVHDYHLVLLPMLIRERLPDATIGFFLHIPFPSFEVFRSQKDEGDDEAEDRRKKMKGEKRWI